VQVAAELLGSYPDGVWLADLAKIAGADAAVPAIASALDVKARGFRTLEEHLLAFLRQKRLLLVLDNCEHVVAEAERVVDLILTTCPDVTLLTTSRERLAQTGERVYRLPSLDVPAAEASYETMLEFSAVALFVDRARAADSHFQFTKSSATAIGDICRRLDGVALAIELAAARVTTLSPQQLLERLREQFRILTGSDRGAHPRHRTMRAALDWSYEWLSQTEQTLFRHLAIFQGGWTTKTIEAATVNANLDEFGVLDVLSSLVNKSIVVAELRGDAQRYRLMEPLRQYGLERLKECGEFDAVAAKHARYFTEYAQQAASHWRTPAEPAALQHVEDEIDNIRATLRWAFLRHNAPVLGAELANYLGNFWLTRHYHEGIRWLECAQAAISYEKHPALSGAIIGHLLRSYAQADTSKTLALCEEAFPLLRSLDDDLPLRRALLFYGGVLLTLNRLDDAERAFQECLELSERAGDAFLSSWQRIFLGRVNTRRGDIERARKLLTQGLETLDRLGLSLDRNRWVALAAHARLEQVAGHLELAIALCREGLRVTQLTQDPLGGVQIEYFLAVLLLSSGADEEARAHGVAALKMSQQELLPHGIAPSIQLLAGVAAFRGLPELAARLHGYTEMRFNNQSHYPRDTFIEVDPERFIGTLRKHFGEAELTALMADGAAWSEERAIQEALSV
jgi:predicted ATPase